VLVRVGEAAEVADGTMRAFDVEGTPVTVANVGGQLYAFDDACTHAWCSLAEGELNGTTVTCLCHWSQFDVRTGQVLQGPADEPVRSRAVSDDGGALLVES
jgi:3-phenylpropionate/trans-cinnamate dioxygenase ferredoxin subunit